MSRFIYRYTGIPGLAFVGVWLVAEILRLVLWIYTPEAHSDNFLSTTLMFFVGAIYDAVVATFFAFALSLLRLLVPSRWLTSKVGNLSGFVILFAVMFGVLFVAVAEWLFWDEFSSRFNFIAVDYLVYRREVTDNINESYNLPLLISGGVIVAAAISLAAFFLHRRRPVPHSIKHRFGLAAVGAVLSLAAASVSSDLSKSVSDNRYVQELAENGIYQFFHAFDASRLDFLTFYDTQEDTENNALLSRELHTSVDHYNIGRAISNRGEEKHLNVMLVVVESLSAKYLGSYGNTEGLTPALDALADKSIVFDQLYATGTRTVRGLEAVSLSIPPTPGRSIIKREHNESLYNIGTEFNNRDYDVNFFYGGFGYFDNMNYFFGHNGFNIIDRTDFTNDEVHFANAWGVADEDLFAKVIKHANSDYQQQKHFFNLIMTTSNHRPYTYPDDRIDIPSGTGRSGAVKYTDYALNLFIEEAKKQPWFDDTVFIIIADHCAGVAGKTALPMNNYHIPLFVYAPKQFPPRHVDTLSSQIDLAPTLLGLLNFSYHSYFFGHDVLADNQLSGKRPQERAFIANYQSMGLYKDKLLTVLEPKQTHYQIVDPLSKAAHTTPIRIPGLLRETIAWYQSADYIYGHGISHVSPIKKRLGR